MYRWIILSVFFLLSCDVRDSAKSRPPPTLMEAAEQGDLQQMDSFLVGKQLLNMRNACLWTPLMKAALNGHVEAVKKLVDKGAEIDLMDKGGYTAMMLAASNNFSEVVDLLIQNGADINHIELTHGWSALIWAAKRGHRETVEVLLKHQPDKMLQDDEQKTALDHARENQFDGIVGLLNGR